MPDSHAEQLDPSVLGEEIGQDERAADAEDYPPEAPLGVDDPSIVASGMIARDDVAQRQARMRPDHGEIDPHGDVAPDEASGRRPGGPGVVDPSEVTEPGDRPTIDDTESQLVADAAGEDDGPEAAAMRVRHDSTTDPIG